MDCLTNAAQTEARLNNGKNTVPSLNKHYPSRETPGDPNHHPPDALLLSPPFAPPSLSFCLLLLFFSKATLEFFLLFFFPTSCLGFESQTTECSRLSSLPPRPFSATMPATVVMSTDSVLRHKYNVESMRKV